jgi:uncharacterized membrane protein
MTYFIFKILHILGVVLFLGNIIVTGVWKVMADRTGEPRTVAYAQQLVTLTDWIFTAGGVVLIIIGATAWCLPQVSTRSGRRGSFGGKACLSPQA